MTIVRLLVAGALLVAGSEASEGQSIASRVSAAGDGKVRMTFAARDDICGFGNGISSKSSRGGNWTAGHSEDVEYDAECSEGPVRIVVEKKAGRIAGLAAYVGGRWRPAPATDLGIVGAREATEWLLSVASRGPEKISGKAIFAVTLADSVRTGPALAAFAKNDGNPSAARDQAIFWLGQTRGGSTELLSRLYSDLKEEKLRDKVIFSLSQQRDPAAVEKLMDIARNDPDRDLRRKALFWLGQSRDPRVATMLWDMINR